MLASETFEKIRSHILDKLSRDLAKDLYYHCVEHTIDVELQAERIAVTENITSDEDLFLLKIACLYHDTGFIFTYQDHETAGCDLAITELSGFGLDAAQIEIVCGLINATRIPQNPHTKLEEIICDADLDYLGRDDFFETGNQLYMEFKARAMVKNENDWNLVQLKFFNQHQYFTATTKALREEKKQQHLEIIKSMLVLA